MVLYRNRKFYLFFAAWLLNFTQIAFSDDLKGHNEMINEWLQKVNAWESRPTASKSHVECVNWIAEEFQKLGLEVKRDYHDFSKYEVSDTRLFVGKNSESLQIASVYPFSGLTGESGVEAPMIYMDGKRCRKAKGKIAVVEVPNKAIPTEILFDEHDTLLSGKKVLPDEIINPVLSSTLFGPDLDAYKKAGAAAVIAVWKNMSGGMAERQYLPFTLPYHSMPAVWIAEESGKRLINEAKNGSQAKLILSGELSKDNVASLWTIIEGEKSDESILVVTHTDGTNPVEENGFVGLLSIAKRIVESGKKPQKNIVFVAVAGHLRLADISTKKRQQATTIWLREHPELWNGKKGNSRAVAAIVLEHLGAMEWGDSVDGYVPSGDPAIEITYATTPLMRQIVEKNWKKRTTPYIAAVVTPRPIVHFGEGEPLFERKIPEVSILAIPSYLLSEIKMSGTGISVENISDIVNKDIVIDQCNVAYDVLNDLLETPSKSFGKVERVGFFGKLRDLFKAAKVLFGS
ncbi:MAG: hypothetical protein Q4F84_03865 [Fibrobacter sp.]|nr:hypothetical protein [Fibrobacter sp.]